MRLRLTSGAVMVAMTAACAPKAVVWDAPAPAAGVMPEGGRLSLGSDGGPVFVAAWEPPAKPAGDAMCPGSFVAARAKGDTVYAAWWMPRADSTAALRAARSDDGGRSWGEPETADSTDRGRTGCRRESPYVNADESNGYVQIVYFMVAPEGPGIFFTHSMERGEMYHAPVPIVYGERPSAAAVASRGDTVVVAFEDPNASVPQLWLAFSGSTGHIFERREAVSSSSVAASRPAVALLGRRIAASWTETTRDAKTGAQVLRTGTLQWP